MAAQQNNSAGKPFWWRFVWPVKLAVGIVLLGLWIVGWLLPVVPGWPFLIAAIFLIAPESRIARWIKRKAHDWRVARQARSAGQGQGASGGPKE